MVRSKRVPTPWLALASVFRGTKRLVGISLGALLALSIVGLASAQGASWLDTPPQQWNTAGAAVPAAPSLAPETQAMCRDQERQPSGTEEAQLSQAGWLLETYWPTQRQGNVAVILGNSNYDGMCRPLEFNAFVFVGGRYAGTLSPVNMNSRTDGVLQDVPTLPANGDIQATFTRYAATDPLCCPSLPPTTVTYRIDQLAAGPVVTAIQIGSQTTAPAELPKTGEWFWIEPMTALAGLGVLGLGLKVRQVR